MEPTSGRPRPHCGGKGGRKMESAKKTGERRGEGEGRRFGEGARRPAGNSGEGGDIRTCGPHSGDACAPSGARNARSPNVAGGPAAGLCSPLSVFIQYRFFVVGLKKKKKNAKSVLSWKLKCFEILTMKGTVDNCTMIQGLDKLYS